MTMNEEMELKRKAEDAAKERVKQAEEAKRDANSTLAQMDRAAAARDAEPAAPPQQQYRQQGSWSAKPGEVSALWWLNMPGI